jgi:SAM-dependent methyltransferase
MTHEPFDHAARSGEGRPSVADEQFWDQRYRGAGAVWSRDPNPQLVREADGLAAGSALDAGSGEGADAIWLAEHGWQVTAVDFSSVALDRGAARAVELGVNVARRITWLYADLSQWTPAVAAYDLVSAQFMQLPQPFRDALFTRLAAAVAPGGTLLVVGHHPSDLQSAVPRPPMPELYFTGSDLAAGLDPASWRIVVNEARPREVLDPAGHPATINDTVLCAQRGA